MKLVLVPVLEVLAATEPGLESRVGQLVHALGHHHLHTLDVKIYLLV